MLGCYFDVVTLFLKSREQSLGRIYCARYDRSRLIVNNKMHMQIESGWLTDVERQPSPHFDERETLEAISLLVIHNISLPPGKFGGSYITDLFLGQLNKEADPFFEHIYQLRVSAHCLIRRDGHVVQYVAFDKRAWHAGVSNFQGREKCNDFSIGIELEGTDDIPYTGEQYQKLSEITALIQRHYPSIDNNIVGHCDIAPGRKSDPGPSFDWKRYRQAINECSVKEQG